MFPAVLKPVCPPPPPRPPCTLYLPLDRASGGWGAGGCPPKIIHTPVLQRFRCYRRYSIEFIAIKSCLFLCMVCSEVFKSCRVSALSLSPSGRSLGFVHGFGALLLPPHRTCLFQVFIDVSLALRLIPVLHSRIPQSSM
jgi:hypothetical protein